MSRSVEFAFVGLRMTGGGTNRHPTVEVSFRIRGPLLDTTLPVKLEQLWSMLVYGSGGSLLLGSLNGFAVAEAHAIDHLSEALRAVQPTPVPLGRLGKLEDHCNGGLA